MVMATHEEHNNPNVDATDRFRKQKEVKIFTQGQEAHLL